MRPARPPPASSNPRNPGLALGWQSLSPKGCAPREAPCPAGPGPLLPGEGVDAQVIGPCTTLVFCFVLFACGVREPCRAQKEGFPTATGVRWSQPRGCGGESMWGALLARSSTPWMKLRPQEPQGALLRAGKLCVHRCLLQGREGLQAWEKEWSPWAVRLLGTCRLQEGPRGTDAEWVPGRAWLGGVFLSSLWSPGAKRSAFPCVQLEGDMRPSACLFWVWTA